ncbi:MAG: hypothetical protein KTR31_18405 [Myxococcales bacterium]|nr:hypothetical protein [Myxococcales bacterium]
MSSIKSGKIVFASGKTGDYDLWSVDLASGRTAQLTRGTFWNDKPKWSPDGRSIVFTSNRAGMGQEIFCVDADGQNTRQLTSLGRWADSPAFSPDGSRIAYVSNQSGDNDIWLMNADGSNATQVTDHPASDTHARFTPDGNGLLFSSDRGDDSDIWHIDLSSGHKTQLNEDRGWDISPTPSPDGTLIAFCSDRQQTPNPEDTREDRDKDIWLMAADGSMAVRLTANQGADFAPAWSPDGNAILYTANEPGADSHLRVIDVSAVRAAFATRDQAAIDAAASRVRPEKVSYDRSGMKADIGGERTSTWVTRLLPESWVAGLYPAGHFGKERNADWVGA